MVTEYVIYAFVVKKALQFYKLDMSSRDCYIIYICHLQ